MNPKTLYRCRLRRFRELTPNMRELVVDIQEPPEMAFQSGQFVMLQIPSSEGKKEQRAYSIASDARNSREFTLLIKLIPGGLASAYVQALREGQDIFFKGPFGKHEFHRPPPQQVLLLATGAGLSQLYSYVLTHGEHHPETRFFLYLGLWTENDVFYSDELERLKNRLSNFEYQYVLDQPTPTWGGRRGYVTECLKEHPILEKPTDIYLCGNPNMIKSVKSHLEALGFPKERVFAEAFY